MFFKKEIRREIKEIKEMLLQMECPHQIEDLIIAPSVCWIGNEQWSEKRCNVCHKVFERYRDRASALKARNELMKALIKINEEKIGNGN